MNKHIVRCKQIRKDNGLSKFALSKIIGCTSQSLVNWEQGKVIPSGPAQLILMIASTPKGFKAVKEAAIKLAKEL